MKNLLYNNLAALVVTAFFLTLAGIGWLAQFDMNVALFQQQVDLSLWGSLFLAACFGLMAWCGLGQANEPQASAQREPGAPAKDYGQASEVKSRYPNLSQEERLLRA